MRIFTGGVEGPVVKGRRRRVPGPVLRREVDALLAELDQREPGTLGERDRQVWTPAMLDRLWRMLDD